ncbi:hypothetical protein [Vibrio phage PJN101]|nr:hypothetical protein [Vibrio phage PJN101]
MAFTKIESDGMYPLNNDMNTESTTIYVGDLGGATVSIGHKDPDGNWNPFPNGTLTSHTPLSISHGHDVLLIAIAVNVSGEINIETRKEGIGGIQGLLMQIEENTASPIKVDAPPGVPSLREEGQWVEGVPRTEYEEYKDSRNVAIIYGNNSTVTTPTDDAISWTLANIAGLLSPPGYNSNWTFDPATAVFTYIGTSGKAYEITAGGTVDSDSVTDTDHIFVRLVEPTGPMTGTSKRYAAGRSGGQVTSSIGFTSNGFGIFNNGDQLRLEIAKDFAGYLIITDLIMAFRPL